MTKQNLNYAGLVVGAALTTRRRPRSPPPPPGRPRARAPKVPGTPRRGPGAQPKAPGRAARDSKTDGSEAGQRRPDHYRSIIGPEDESCPRPPQGHRGVLRVPRPGCTWRTAKGGWHWWIGCTSQMDQDQGSTGSQRLCVGVGKASTGVVHF